MRHVRTHTSGRKTPPPRHTREGPQSLLIDVVLGGLYGAVIGAVGLGIAASLSITGQDVQFFPWGFVVMAFFFAGGIAGAIIGGIIAATQVEQGKGALLGGAIGFVIACYFFSNTPHLELTGMLQGALVITTGAIIGWLTAFRLHAPW